MCSVDSFAMAFYLNLSVHDQFYTILHYCMRQIVYSPFDSSALIFPTTHNNENVSIERINMGNSSQIIRYERAGRTAQTTNGENNNNTNVYMVLSDEISLPTCSQRKYAPPLFPAVFYFSQ